MMRPGERDEAWGDWLRARLFDRRLVSITGVLDDSVATRAATELMTLDSNGDDAVRVLIDSGGGTLEAAFMLMDVIDLLGVPVRATCVGRADGPAVGVFAVAATRCMTPHARLHLCEPASEFEGRGSDLVAWAQDRERQLERFCERVSAAARCSPDRIASAMREGRYLDAHEAVRLGLADEIARANVASIHRLDGRPIGFHSS
jgi:ATP-dependent Clp protease protease subunit